MRIKLLFKYKMSIAFAAAITILLIVGAFTYRSVANWGESNDWVRHTHEVLQRLQAVRFALESVESNARAFALTNDGSFLTTSKANIGTANHEVLTLEALTADNFSQQRRLVALNRLILQEIAFTQPSNSLAPANHIGAGSTTFQSEPGLLTMTEIQTLIHEMAEEEGRLLRQRIAKADRLAAQTRDVLVLGTALALMISAAAAWSVYQDGSRSRSAEEALKFSEALGASETERSAAKYRGLLEAAPDAMVVLNRDGEIVLVNVQAEKQFGYRRDSLIGQKVTSIIPVGFAERLIADETRSSEDALAQQIGTGIELIGHRKDGSTFPIEIMLSPLKDGEGMLVTAAIRDISMRKNAEQHLLQIEGKYRGLLEAAPDAMVVVNQDGEIVLLNVQAEAQFGYHHNQLLRQKVTKIIPCGFAERLIADGLRSAEDALAQQISTGIELIGQREDGTKFPIWIMLSPLESADGILVTAAIRDISIRKEAEALLIQTIDELKRSNEELGQFASIASHDLQEPLRMIASYTQLLSKRYKGKLDAEADEFIAFAVEGANRMQRLIQDLLAYSRVGTKGNDLSDTSSEDALKRALVNLLGAVRESGAEVTHDPLPRVRADEGQLTQLFQNLVGNAIKYHSSATPRVHIAAKRNDTNKWMFSVKDNGLGIDPKYFEKIFGMFQRLHRREEFDGTGIGLAICKKIVQRHGGDISIESQLGHGSTFHFALAASERNT